MSNLAKILGVLAVLALLTPAEAGGLKGGKARAKISLLNDTEAPDLLGECFEGNNRGDKAWAELTGDWVNILPGLAPSASGGAGGDCLDLTSLRCIPDYLVIKGGNGYVVLTAAELAGKDKIYVSETCLANGGGNPPDISHWDAYGCRRVPEPSSLLGSLGALMLGGWIRHRQRRTPAS